jgi:integrase/recombinase XerC
MVCLYEPKLKEVEITGYLFIDKHERVIELPSRYINSLFNGTKYSKETVKQYAKVLKYLCDYIETEFPTQKVDDILVSVESHFFDRYFKKLDLMGKERSTLFSRDAIFKGFMNWLTSNEGGRVRDTSGYKVGGYVSKPPKKLPKYVTVEEVIQFLNFFHDENQRCLMHYMFDTGVRISEAPRAKYTDLPDLSLVPLEQNYFQVLIQGSKGKGGQIKERYTYMTRAIIERIRALHNTKLYMKARLKYGKDMPLFLNVFGEPVTKNSIKDLIYKAQKRAEMSMHAHKFRHGFAMSILASELNEKYQNLMVIAKETLGHEHISTTQIYGAIPPQAIEGIRKKNQEHQIHCRFEESQKIYQETFKPQKKHTEKRGRKKHATIKN